MSNLTDIYQDRFVNTGLEKRQRVWRVLLDSYFQNLIPPDSTVLDLACGYGEFSNNVKAKQKFAVDLNPDVPRYLNSDVSFHLGPANNLSHLADNSVDRVFTSNFLEHLPTKEVCDQVFAEVRRVLKPGGKFLILGPNIRYAYREYWDFYDHYLPLSHVSLVEGLKISGYQIESVIDRFLPYTMNNNSPTSDWLIRAYLSFPFAWKIIGKQFFVVARK